MDKPLLTEGQLENIEDNLKDLESYDINGTKRIISNLISDLRHYKQALEWYADIYNYSGMHSAVWQDEGKLAREALGKENPDEQATGDKRAARYP